MEVRLGMWRSTTRTGWLLTPSLWLGLAALCHGQTQQLLPDNVQAGDRFGWSVVLAGEDLVVGAAFDDVGALDEGSAYAFRRRVDDPIRWGAGALLIDDIPQPIDEFGFAVDIEGNTLAVGVEDDDGTRGGVMLFERSGVGTAWQPSRKILLDDAMIEDSLGVSLDLDGDFLLVGSVRGILRDDPPGGVNLPGVAHLFHRHQGQLDQWGRVTPLQASDGQAGDAFGHAVSMSGDLVVVGAPGTESRGDEGAVYVFRRHAGGLDNWGEVQRLRPHDVGPGDTFGWEVELSPDGSRLWVGAPRQDAGATNAGAVYLFEWRNGVFEEVEKLQASVAADTDLFGFSLSTEGDLLAVGSIFAEETGSVDVFRLDGTWQPVVRLTPPAGDRGEQFGFSLDMDRGTLGVGAPYHQEVGPEGGIVYLFRLEEWLPQNCVPGDPQVLCLRDGRFEASIAWSDFGGESGHGKTVPLATETAGLFWFFQPDNWEIQVKVIDGCAFNQRYWVFAAATTDVAYTLTVTDTASGAEMNYENALGTSAAAITDTDAFATCP